MNIDDLDNGNKEVEPEGTPEVILTTFANSISRNQPVLFCVKCGSTTLDQSSIYKLECYNCNNTILWNGHSFNIAREGHPHDVVSAITPPVRPDFFDTPYDQMILALHRFGRVAIDARLDEQAKEEEKQRLSRAWEVCKAEIDSIINIVHHSKLEPN